MLLVACREDRDRRVGGLPLSARTYITRWARSGIHPKLISERTTAALAHLRAQGRRVSGRVPYGFDLGTESALVRNAQEQEVIAMTRELRAEGRSLRAIVTELKARAIPTKYSGNWTPAT